MIDPVELAADELRGKLRDIQQSGDAYCAFRAAEARKIFDKLIDLLVKRFDDLVPKAHL